MSISWQFVVILVFGLYFNFVICEESYPERFLEDICKDRSLVKFYLDLPGQPKSYGILHASRSIPYNENIDCIIYLEPPLEGYGVTISFRSIDFIPGCFDYLKVYDTDYGIPTKLCNLNGKIDYPEEGLAFYSKGSMKLHYHTSTQSLGFYYKTGFELVYTVYTKDSGKCYRDGLFQCANDRCIPKGLKCDGHNNCGDNSDENLLSCDYDDFAGVSGVTIAFICIGSILGTAVVITCIAILCLRRKREVGSVVSNEPNMPPGHSPYQAVHPTGYFVSQNPAGPNTLYPPQYTTVNTIPAEEGFSNPCYPSGIPQPPPPPYKP